jgi:NADH-quinone oxidoreductase subunit L
MLLGLVPLLPALGFVILGLFGRRMSMAQVRLVACGVIGLAFVASLVAALPVLLGRLETVSAGGVVVNAAARSVEVTFWEWLPLGARHGASPELHGHVFLENLSIPFGLYLDPLAAAMILVITGVGFLIHVYAAEYMAHEEGYWRFFTYMNLFVAMMLILVLGSSFPLMFVGWEGVGLCSYLLIGFYYQQEVPPQAGLKAFLVNRVGDAGFLLGMMLLLLTFGSLRYAELFPRVAGASEYVGTGLALATAALLFVGAMGKSAQFPLHVWLPDAMAGPTPVSALIHAATMVTAGVYLVIRANVVFQAAPAVSAIVAIVGLVTALMAATIALVQVDLKRVLAYSTVSQLGYMFIAVGVGAYAAGLFHLVTHAFFKALLFLGAGSVSHAMSGELDMRKMGGLASKLPHTRRVMAVATWAIAGLPLLSGFWSKDEILAGVVTSTLPDAMKWIIWAGALLGALLTAFYMYRLYFMTFGGQPRWSEGVHPHESPAMMTFPLWILAVLSAVGGVLGLAAWTGAPNLLHHALEPVVFPGTMALGRAALSPGAEIGFAIVATLVATTGAVGAVLLYARRSDVPQRAAQAWPRVREMLRGKYWIDEILGALFVRSTLSLSALAARFDRRVIDLGVEMSGFSTAMLGEALRNLTSGRVRTYALGVLVGAAAIVSWMVLR